MSESLTISLYLTATVTAFLLLFMCVSVYNNLIEVSKEVKKSWANIDVILKQRYDEIPKLIEICNQYIEHEVAMIDRIMESREKLVGAENSRKEKMKASEEISNSLKGLLALSEGYPEIKANNNFIQIQNKISKLEDTLADRREYYNSSVTIYNTRIEQIPYVFFTPILGYKEEVLFKVSEEEKAYPELKIDTLKRNA
ncbi:LemA family protein [Halobacteriovorax sp. HFRX-2_2]|uniref:LemA family protein n=1 Tax=unclassified Halobacteriovorax TaxID=2639665 RepID=UPI0037180E4E